jgi:hypothetical protein
MRVWWGFLQSGDSKPGSEKKKKPKGQKKKEERMALSASLKKKEKRDVIQFSSVGCDSHTANGKEQ